MRIQSLDFLRGIAVILVLFAHHWAGLDYLKNVGWIGVDLFFVLSGFLVSGLLFQEYKKYGSVDAKRFLIRRGFKIYPLFYISYVLTLIIVATVGIPSFDKLNANGKIITVIAEAVFLQNYFEPFWGHHWSLAVEEHFYFLIALSFPFFIKRPRLFLLVFPLSLILRVLTQIYFPHQGFRESHLRMDSLAMGVVISYVFQFHDLRGFYDRYKYYLFAMVPIPLLFMFDNPVESVWIKTIGFTLLYLSFGSVLIISLYNNLHSRAIEWVGYYSYGIYLFHLYWIRFMGPPEDVISLHLYGRFAVYFLGSIFVGAAMSALVEKPFLRMRDKWFSARRRVSSAVLY